MFYWDKDEEVLRTYMQRHDLTELRVPVGFWPRNVVGGPFPFVVGVFGGIVGAFQISTFLSLAMLFGIVGGVVLSRLLSLAEYIVVRPSGSLELRGSAHHTPRLSLAGLLEEAQRVVYRREHPGLLRRGLRAFGRGLLWACRPFPWAAQVLWDYTDGRYRAAWAAREAREAAVIHAVRVKLGLDGVQAAPVAPGPPAPSREVPTQETWPVGTRVRVTCLLESASPGMLGAVTSWWLNEDDDLMIGFNWDGEAALWEGMRSDDAARCVVKIEEG